MFKHQSKIIEEGELIRGLSIIGMVIIRNEKKNNNKYTPYMNLKCLLKGQFLVYLLLLVSCQSKNNRYSVKGVDQDLIIGQTPPQDMVFIPGKGGIPSFYMSVSEEPNINYLIYLEWLETVYGESYPEIYEQALPERQIQNELYKFNDPYLVSYMSHPAFSYYPMTGLSWVQIQSYLEWKTDRMNEDILIKAGFLNFNLEQKDEDSFSTEAYLFHQYQGDVRTNMKDNRTGGYRVMKFNEGILLPGFRLPTEVEWEYASQEHFQRKIDNQKQRRPFSKKSIDHPYGEDYFTLRWGRAYENGGYNIYASKINSATYRDDVLQVSTNRDARYDKEYEPKDVDGYPNRLTSIGDYSKKEKGIINMESNVKEWVMDFYKEDFDNANDDLMEIFNQNGFEVLDNHITGKDGKIPEKDSLGRLRDFRFLGIAFDGTILKVKKYGPVYYNKMKRIEELEYQKSLCLLKIEHIKKNKERKLKLEREITILEYLIAGKKREGNAWEELKKLPEFRIIYETGNYSWASTLIRTKRDFSTLDLGGTVNKLKRLEEKLAQEESEFKTMNAPKRVVRGGTWKVPGKQREGIRETESDPTVGFRCVLPYTGIPVERKYRVKQ